MSHRLTLFASALFFFTLAVLPASAKTTLKSHQDLDWYASKRWIHVDNVDSALAPLFENARKGWLAALRKGDHLLGDGRPLFWNAHHGKVQTYFTFYPFGKWADMDSRADMATRTDKIVGDSTVNAYDIGDSALVPPHYSEMWRRLGSFDIVSSASDSLTDLTGNVGRLEFHQMDENKWDEFTKAWKEVKAALVAAKYPLTCRVYSNMYGNSGGQFVVFWLALDTPAYHAAPPVNKILTRQLGEEKGPALIATLEKIFPVTQFYEVERRPDLSNLGK
jgi:hypothetical protein